MNQWKLKNQVIFGLFLPAFILISICSTLFLYRQISYLDEHFYQNGNSILDQIVPIIRIGYNQGNPHLIEDSINALQQNNDIDSVVLFDSTGKLYLQRGVHNENAHTLTQYKHDVLPDHKLFMRHINLDLLQKNTDAKKSIVMPASIGIQYSIKSLEFEKSQLIIFVVSIASFSIFILGLFCWFFSYHIQSEWRRIRSYLIHLKIKSQQSEKPKFRYPEIKFVADYIEDMHKQINEVQASIDTQLNESHQDLVNNIELLEQQNLHLTKKQKSLSNKIKRQAEFIANLSHEIKTPIASIIGYINILLEGNLTELQRDNLKTIEKSAQDLQLLVNEILFFSKLQAGKIQFELIPVDLQEIVDDVVSTLTPSVQNKSLELIAIIDAAVPWKILTDPVQVKQIFYNFLSNSIKFTEQGHILLHVSYEKDLSQNNKEMIHIRIEDTGIGLSDADQKKIFKEYSQVQSVHGNQGGTGLGLVINQKLIQHMGGTISLQSQLNQGTQITFSIPVQSLSVIHEESSDLKALRTKEFLIFEENHWVKEQLNQMMEKFNLNKKFFNQLDLLKNYLEQNKNKSEIIVILSINDIADELDKAKIIINRFRKNNIQCIILINHASQYIYHDLEQSGIQNCLTRPIRIKKLLQTMIDVAKQKVNETPKSIIPYSILVVEDDLITQKLFHRIFERFFVELTIVATTKKAIDISEKKKFDLIFVDQNLCSSYGSEFAIWLKQNSKLNLLTPLVLMSADKDNYNHELQSSKIIDDFMEKPATSIKISELLKKFIHSDIHKNSQPNLQNSKMNTFIDSEMKQIMINELQEFSFKINKAFEEQDEHSLKKILHQLKGSSSFIGATNLNRVVTEFEKAVKSNQNSHYPSYIADLEFEIESFIKEITAIS